MSSVNGEDKTKIEEALKLRESLLQSFKQQIKLRKNILELENAIMDLNIEAERHKKIIEKFVFIKNFKKLKNFAFNFFFCF